MALRKRIQDGRFERERGILGSQTQDVEIEVSKAIAVAPRSLLR